MIWPRGHTGFEALTSLLLRVSATNKRGLLLVSAPVLLTIRDAILTCARKPTRVSLIYRTEPTTKQ